MAGSVQNPQVFQEKHIHGRLWSPDCQTNLVVYRSAHSFLFVVVVVDFFFLLWLSSSLFLFLLLLLLLQLLNWLALIDVSVAVLGFVAVLV